MTKRTQDFSPLHLKGLDLDERIMMRSYMSAGVVMALALFFLMGGSVCPGWAVAGEPAKLVLENFQSKDSEGFPLDWQHESQRSHAKGREAYKIQSEDGFNFLAAKDAGQRIKNRKIDWDPKAYPVLAWKWRLHKAPADSEPLAVIYASLDTDLLFIPVFTKYVWSATKPEGTLTEGGMFSGSEIVVQGGLTELNRWIEERVNVYEDFKRIHQHEPAAKAWGISIFAGPGVEIDFGPITAISSH